MNQKHGTGDHYMTQQMMMMMQNDTDREES